MISELKFNFNSDNDYDRILQVKICEAICEAQKESESGVTVTQEKPVKTVEQEKPVEKVASTEVTKAQDVVDPEDLSEEDLSQLPTSELLAMLKERGVNAESFPGKNTNKKLRDLFLASVAGTLKASEDDDDLDESPRTTVKSSEIGQKPIGYDEAKAFIRPFYEDTEKRKVIQGMMIEYGASEEKEDGTKKCQLSALKDRGEDYRPLIEAIREKYGK